MGKLFKWIVIIAAAIFFLAVFALVLFFGQGGSKPSDVIPQTDQKNNMDGMKLTSPLFLNNGNFPAAFTCDGRETNPPLDIVDVPKEAKSLALVLRDPDAPAGTFIHWIMWNIDPATKQIRQDSVPQGALQGMATSGKNGYVGPCPPGGTHRYVFTLYALDALLDLPASTTAGQLDAAMAGHILAQTDLHARYR